MDKRVRADWLTVHEAKVGGKLSGHFKNDVNDQLLF